MIWANGSAAKAQSYKYDATKNAAYSGKIEIIEWLVTEKFPLSPDIPEIAACNGSTSILNWWNSKRMVFRSLDDLIAIAFKHGHLDSTKWLIAHGAKVPATACAMAAAGGHLEMLMFARENGGAWGDCMMEAARNGHLHLLEWAHSKGASLHSDICEEAAAGGHLCVLQWARSRNCPWKSPLVLIAAASAGHLSILEWCLENSAEWSSQVSSAAARNGHFPVVRWLSQNGCPLDEKMIFECAASHGDLDTIKWITNERSFACTTRVLALVAASGNLEALRYLYSLPTVPPLLDESVCAAAARQGRFEVLRWLREEANCPWDSRTTSSAFEMNYATIFEWACLNGCPYAKEQFMQVKETMKRKRQQAQASQQPTEKRSKN